MRKLSYFFVFVGAFSVYADESSTSELLEFIDSGLYTCSPLSQVKLTVSEDRKPNVVPSGYIYDVKCVAINPNEKDPKKRPKYRSKPFISFCRLDGEDCKDWADCIAEQRKELKNPSTSFLQAEPEKQDASPEQKTTYGLNCKYSWKTPLVLYRQIPDTEVWDTVCASPLGDCKLPEAIKGSFVATCKALREIKPGLMECPIVQNCLADPIPVSPAKTKTQATR